MAVYTTIDDPSAYFQTAIYTGNGSTIDIVNDGNSDLQPDLLWFKSRSNATDHGIQDSVRGNSLALQSNTNGADGSVGTSQITAIGSDGFSLASGGDVNTNTRTYVCWQWKETADAGFDIVTYTGNGSNRTISHSLSAVPHMMIVKNRDEAEEWTVYHGANTAAPATDYLSLNSTAATADSNTRWNDTTPTSSVFTVGTSDVVNKNGVAYIAYLFSEKQGYSKFGNYTGNANADGTFVYTGFKPAWVMVKKSSATNNWVIQDTKRNPHNMMTEFLMANVSDAESTGLNFDFLSNGFKLRSNSGGSNSAATYIYMAFAESPLVTSTGVPATAR